MICINVARLPSTLGVCAGQYLPLPQCTAYWNKCQWQFQQAWITWKHITWRGSTIYFMSILSWASIITIATQKELTKCLTNCHIHLQWFQNQKYVFGRIKVREIKMLMQRPLNYR